MPQYKPTPQELQRQARIRDLTAERDALPRRIAAKEAQEVRLRESLVTYQARIAAVPARETELVELTRDYETLRQIYTGLLTKNENARASANLLGRQIGEQFRLLEPARLPERPISPNRPQIYTMGALWRTCAGSRARAIPRLSRPDAGTEADLIAAFALPVLALVPTMAAPSNGRSDAGQSKWRSPLACSPFLSASSSPGGSASSACDTDMYEKFFGVRERPFDLTPNPRFMYFTPRHREALVNLQFGIESRKGVVVLIGEAGMGKTTVIRAAIEKQRNNEVRLVYLNNPLLTRAEFIEFLANALQLSTAAERSKTRLVAELASRLTEERQRGATVVFLVDEAQSPQTSCSKNFAC